MTERVAALRIERWNLEGIKPHPKNPRSIPPKGSKKWDVLKRSLDHDYFDPLVVNMRNSMLVSGHQRLPMMIELGYTSADVSVVDYDEPTHYARMIAANRHIGEFEEVLLSSLIGEIEGAGLDAALAGFDDKAFMAMLEGPKVVEEQQSADELLSRAEELQVQWNVKPGDMYQVGSHRLLCADAESLDSWQLLLQGQLADLVWIDPPYNVGYDASRNSGKKKQLINNDDVTPEEYRRLAKAWFDAVYAITKPGGAIYVAHADTTSTTIRIAFEQAGWYLSQTLVWVKQQATLSRQDHQWQHEPILYGWKPGAGHYWQGGYAQKTIIDEEVNLAKLSKTELVELVNELRNSRDSSVVREPKPASSELHPTTKPLPLVARQIWNSSRRGETVAEQFGGSGTTMAAAEQTGRRCVCTENDPKYCAVILERMSAYGLSIERVRHG